MRHPPKSPSPCPLVKHFSFNAHNKFFSTLLITVLLMMIMPLLLGNFVIHKQAAPDSMVQTFLG